MVRPVGGRSVLGYDAQVEVLPVLAIKDGRRPHHTADVVDGEEVVVWSAIFEFVEDLWVDFLVDGWAGRWVGQWVGRWVGRWVGDCMDGWIYGWMDCGLGMLR